MKVLKGLNREKRVIYSSKYKIFSVERLNTIKNQCKECGRIYKNNTTVCPSCGNLLIVFNFRAELEKALLNTKSPQLFRLYSELYVQTAGVTEIGVDYDILTDKLTDKQRNILGCMLDEKYVSLLGSRKTGKTFLIALAIILLGIKEKLEVNIMSSKKEMASQVIYMILGISDEFGLNLIKRPAKEEIRFRNGTRVKVLANTLAGAGTLLADILVIDEAQEVDETIWGKVAPMIAGGKLGKVWLFGTAKSGSQFYKFWYNKSSKFKKFTMYMEDATWVTPEQWKDIEALMDNERMIRQELHLEWVEGEGVFFRSADVELAFEDYVTSPLKDYKETICCVDYGLGHETTMYILGINGKIIEELDSWAMTNPTAEMILSKCDEYYKLYNPFFILEGSPLGGFVRRDQSTRDYKMKTSNFSTNKDKFISALAIILNKQRIRLRNYRLKFQLLRYNGDKKDDDHVDAVLHGCKYFFGKYIKKDINVEDMNK